ncbi:hypothetical protein CR513_15289, partial [Mucuna pruriens]
MEDVRRGEKNPCENWEALKRLMRARFVPSSYNKNIHNKLQRLYQRARSVKEYHKEIEMNLIRAQIRECKEATLAWFLHAFNREIQDVVEFQYCRNLSKIVHQAIKVEMQIRRRNASKKTYVGISGWKVCLDSLLLTTYHYPDKGTTPIRSTRHSLKHRGTKMFKWKMDVYGV